MKLALYVPNTYLQATDEERAEVCNGCGAKDGVKVPSTMWFLCVVLACNIHDWMFKEGKTLGDFWFANLIFFWNMTAIIYNGSNFLMLLPRMERALKYFLAVLTKMGQDAYWVDKVKNEDKHITIRGELV